MKKKIRNAIIKLCLRASADDILCYEDTRDMLDDVDWSMLSIEPSDFVDVYSFKAGGDYFLVHNFKNKKLFRGKRAVKLHESVNTFTSEAFCSAEILEVWLTEDMKTEYVKCFRMDINGNGGDYTAEYRYLLRGDFPEFEVECCLSNLLSWYGINKYSISEENISK